MSASIIVTPATLGDLPAVVELFMQVEAQHEAYWPLRWKMRPGVREGYLQWLRSRIDDPRMLILAAHDERAEAKEPPEGPQSTASHRVVGALLAAIETDIPIYLKREYAFIHDLAVRADFRRQGIAGHMLKLAGQWAHDRGMNQLRLMVAEQNNEGRSLFDHAGFRRTYQEMVLPV